ncbi:TPA: hypothetical protein ACM2VU_004278 [Pseudomonas aeruginosa]|uniref:hypothetical protein n=1 Tax=Pseudomonas aeruginosa TaxID=287 RepID=UPI003B247CE5
MNKALVEQAGGDERAAFEKIHTVPRGIMWNEEKGQYVRVHEKHCSLRIWNSFVALWAGWMARAALAQPCPEPFELRLCEQRHTVLQPGRTYLFTVDPNCPACVAMAEGKRQPAEQAEAEQPKLERPNHWNLHSANFRAGFKAAEAQHERIVGALRAELETERMRLAGCGVAALGYFDGCADAYKSASLSDVLRLRADCDAALAEVERLRQFERICEGLPQDAIDGGWTVQGIRGYAKRLEDQLKVALARVAELERKLRDEENAHTTTIEQRDNAEHWADQLAKAIAERFGVDIGEHSNLNCPWNEALVWMQQPPAQAQHSVPEEFSFEYRHPNGECHTVTVSREQVINEMPDFLFEALCSKFCNCEPVGETNVVECCCDEYAEEFKLIAAAPGKEVGHE